MYLSLGYGGEDLFRFVFREGLGCVYVHILLRHTINYPSKSLACKLFTNFYTLTLEHCKLLYVKPLKCRLKANMKLNKLEPVTKQISHSSDDT
jgi:hypothetical protein